MQQELGKVEAAGDSALEMAERVVVTQPTDHVFLDMFTAPDAGIDALGVGF